MPSNALQDARRGARDVVPLAVGVAVYGLAFGLMAAQAGIAELQVGVMGMVVFAGSSQIVAVERLMSGAGAVAALAAGVALNLRLFLMTAALRDDLAGRPWWQVGLGVHLTADENWALMHATRAKGQSAGYGYLVGGGLCVLVAWLVATVAGAAFARAIPEPRALGMDFAFTAAFIAILRGLWRGQPDLWPWVVSAGVAGALVVSGAIEPSWALVVGGLAGAAMAGWGPGEAAR